MSSLIRTIFLLFALSLSACGTVIGDNGYFHDRSSAYLKAQNGKSLQLPPGLSRSNMTTYYNIPASSGRPTSTALPPHSLAVRSGSPVDRLLQPAIPASKVALKANGTKTAIVIDKPYAEAWASVASGLQRQRMPVAKVDKSKHRYVVADTYPTFDQLSSDSPLYDLIVTELSKQQTKVEVRTHDGQLVNTRTVDRLLTRLSQGLEGKSKDQGMNEWVHSLL